MKIEFVGDVVTQPLNSLIQQLDMGSCDVLHHPIDQHFQVLISDSAPDVLVLHAALSFFLDDGSGDDPIAKMKAYCEAIHAYSNTRKTLVVLNTLMPLQERVVGFAHFEHLQLVAGLNGMLFDCAAGSKFVTVADLAGVIARCGTDHAINMQNAMVMRMPYTRQVIPQLLSEYARSIRERFVPRKKVLLLDADNTLWGGIVGEDGIAGIAVDGQFPGLIHRKFQRSLVELRTSGILLALVSKNNEVDVREAFAKVDMPLKWDSFAATRVNWLPKSENIASIAQELNVGLDSMVFIDDNPFELEEVAASYPVVDCRQFDRRKVGEALTLLQGIRDLHCWSTTAEDAVKSEQYEQEAARKQFASVSTSLDDYIKSLDIRVEIGCNRPDHAKRISQLTNKTNQFNLTTRRYSEAEVLQAMSEGQVFDLRVLDRFGDMGIVGVAIVRDANIEAFLMSCRALGRRVESTMLDYVCYHAQSRPLKSTFVRTEKNQMVSNFFDSNGFSLLSETEDTKTYLFNGQVRDDANARVIGVD